MNDHVFHHLFYGVLIGLISSISLVFTVDRGIYVNILILFLLVILFGILFSLEESHVIKEKFIFDVWYVENQSFMLDLKILFMTVWKVLKREGISNTKHATMPEFKGNKS